MIEFFRILGWGAMVVGVFLLVFGIVATQEVGEKFMRGFSGHYTNETMWYILGGLALIIAGTGLSRIKR